MLQLIYGADRIRNSDEILGELCNNAATGVEKQILIVPEQFSHDAERMLCRRGGDTISRYAEVLSFSRLASRVFSVCGGVCEEYLDKGGRLLSVYLAVEQVLGQIKYYAAVCRKPEFLQRLGSAMEEFLSYELQPGALSGAARHFSGQFAQKLTELGLIYESYLSVCKTGRQDPVTRLVRLNTLLRREDYAQGRLFYVDGFSDFTAVELQIMTALLQASDRVTVALTTDGSNNPAFSTARETMRQLKKSADRCNIPYAVRQSGGRTCRAEALEHALRGLFSATVEPYQGNQSPVRLHQAESAAGECEYAAWLVRRLVSGGARYRELYVAVTDEARYLPLLRGVFARAGIPAYFAGSADILQKPLTAAVLAALQAVERFDYDSVLRYLKSGFTALTPDACDRLEQYASLWNVRGRQWQTDWTEHPQGMGQSWNDELRAYLDQLNLWREAVIAPLTGLKQAFAAATSVQGMTAAVEHFLEEIQLRQTLETQTKQLYTAGQLQQAQEAAQLYDCLLQALAQTDQVIGGCAMTPEQFVQVFRLVLGQYQVRTIPATLDAVQVGGLPAFRHARAAHLVVLGAEDGLLPSFSLPVGVFTDAERQELLGLGVSLSPAQEQKLEREFGSVYASFSAAEQSISMSCSSQQPSYLLRRMQQLFPQAGTTGAADVQFLPDAPAAAASLLRGGFAPEPDAPDVLLQCLYDLQRRSGYEFGSLSQQTVQGLYGHKLYLSASRIDQFAACQLAYFLHYGLKAQPWKQARFDAPVFGTFVHYVLECTVRDVQAQGGFRAVSEQTLGEIAQKHMDDYTKFSMPDLQKRGERFSFLYKRSLDEVRTVVQDVGRELRGGQFEPVDTELEFSQNGKLPPVEIEGSLGAAQVSGFVDRVDLYEQNGVSYYRVVDYKTGHKDFDYAGILNGEGLQMLIYLFALKKHGQALYGRSIHPAGVLYVPARSDLEKIDAGGGETAAAAAHAASHRRKGLVLDDAALLQAMEPGEGKPEYLPCKWKDGEAQGDVASVSQLQLLERFVSDQLRAMTDRMYAGAVQPDPIIRGPQNTACGYCDYQSVCHKDACAHKNRYIAAVKPAQFWQEVERSEKEHG